MKLLVVSDTHNITSQLEKILAGHADEVKMVCHIGNAPYDLMKYQPMYPNLPMIAIAGNGDYDERPEAILEFSPCLDAGKEILVRILLIHGHRHGVYDGIDRLIYYTKQKGANAVFFGHTHIPLVTTVDGIYVMNPGSPSCPRGNSKASYGIVEISPEGEITGRIYPV
ncbi:MAG: metallophosphatase family protein [Defluviitaleaceae bacterium]|nr:metallophosphatase family protein [Defluviitaleaceae bacterium]